jgi:hypothetical protein
MGKSTPEVHASLRLAHFTVRHPARVGRDPNRIAVAFEPVGVFGLHLAASTRILLSRPVFDAWPLQSPSAYSAVLSPRRLQSNRGPHGADAMNLYVHDFFSEKGHEVATDLPRKPWPQLEVWCFETALPH